MVEQGPGRNVSDPTEVPLKQPTIAGHSSSSQQGWSAVAWVFGGLQCDWRHLTGPDSPKPLSAHYPLYPFRQSQRKVRLTKAFCEMITS